MPFFTNKSVKDVTVTSSAHNICPAQSHLHDSLVLQLSPGQDWSYVRLKSQIKGYLYITNKYISDILPVEFKQSFNLLFADIRYVKKKELFKLKNENITHCARSLEIYEEHFLFNLVWSLAYKMLTDASGKLQNNTSRLGSA